MSYFVFCLAPLQALCSCLGERKKKVLWKNWYYLCKKSPGSSQSSPRVYMSYLRTSVVMATGGHEGSSYVRCCLVTSLCVLCIFHASLADSVEHLCYTCSDYRTDFFCPAFLECEETLRSRHRMIPKIWDLAQQWDCSRNKRGTTGGLRKLRFFFPVDR